MTAFTEKLHRAFISLCVISV